MKTLDASQEKAIIGIANNKNIAVLTGGPGFGKTFTIKALLQDLFNEGLNPEKVYLACPTGKAAKVLDKSLAEDDEEPIKLENRPATIHRLLGCNGPLWEFNKQNKLEADCIIIDEASMVDSLLMARVLESVSTGCKFVFVGDKDQLPPVGAGCAFRDIIAANLPDTVYRLEKNHRQAAGSLIADACGHIINGERPTFGEVGAKTLGGERLDDLFHIEEEEKEDIPALLVDVVRGWHDKKKDYCVLAPQKTGVCGVEAINKHLQESLNPASDSKQQMKVSAWLTIREGDKVMHIKNNYGLDVFNGFTGVVVSVDPIFEQIVVDFDGQIVTYTDKADLKELVLGYCMTIHKGQGSQYQHGAIICHSSHYYMWSRQLLYTAVSRFREELHIIGNKKALKRAISNSVEDSRQTYLSLALVGETEK